VCTSATTNLGIQPLLDAIVSYVPSPASHALPAVDTTGEAASYDPGDTVPTAIIWKTIADAFAGRVILLRVASGSLKDDSAIHNVNTDVHERIGTVTLMQGKTQESIGEVRAGDLGAVSKLKDTRTGDTLAKRGSAWRFAPFRFTEPVLSYAIEPKSRGDEEKINTALQRLAEEDPTIRYTRDARAEQLLLSGQGQLHIEVTVAKLRRRFGVEVTLNLPRIPYRETIKGATRSRPVGMVNSATARSGSRHSSEARASGLSTRSSVGLFRGDLSRLSKRASKRRVREDILPGTRWWTSPSRCTTGRFIRWTPMRCHSEWPGDSHSAMPCLAPNRPSSNR
jgi:translation elongation factor EF-G